MPASLSESESIKMANVKKKKSLINQKNLVCLGGTFLQYDKDNKRLLDLSKSLLKSPSRIITNERNIPGSDG